MNTPDEDPLEDEAAPPEEPEDALEEELQGVKPKDLEEVLPDYEAQEEAPEFEEPSDETQAQFARRVLDFEHKKPYYLLIFLFFLPCLWAVFIGVGWSKEDKIEDHVYKIWTRQRSEFAKDVDYAAQYDRANLGATTFAAMAIARDGENLITKDRLEEIMARMQETESTTVGTIWFVPGSHSDHLSHFSSKYFRRSNIKTSTTLGMISVPQMM